MEELLHLEINLLKVKQFSLSITMQGICQHKAYPSKDYTAIFLSYVLGKNQILTC